MTAWEPGPFLKLMGIRVLIRTAQRSEAELVVREELTNRRGVMHGGAIMGWGDIMGGMTTVAALPEGHRTATIESKTNFFAPIPKGDTARAVTTPLHIGRSTIVSEDGRAATGLNKASISVGQQIDASGQGSVDSTGKIITLDATAGQVRLAPTSLWGSLNSATPASMTVNLLALGDYAPAAFNFAGTGTASGSDAVAASYVVNTGSIDQSATAAGTLLKANGFVSAFGSAPPDFDAMSVTPGSAVGSQLIVEWGSGGATAPFTTYTSAGLVVDLTNTHLGTTHLIRTGPASVGITTSPLISFDPATLQLAIGNATSLSVFNTAAGFLSQLTTTLNGSTAVFKLVAVGQYDAAANTFQASRINIALE